MVRALRVTTTSTATTYSTSSSSARRGPCTTHLARLSSTTSTNPTPPTVTPLEYRDVFVHDPAFPADRWDAQVASLKHPHSGHAVARYAAYIHRHAVYNFNQVGEYSLNVTPIRPWPHHDGAVRGTTSGTSASATATTTSSTSTSNEEHTVIIHPDGLSLHHLRDDDDVAAVCGLILQDLPLSRERVVAALPSHVRVTPSPPLTVVAARPAAVAASTTVAKTVLQWFHDALLPATVSSSSSSVVAGARLYLASDMKGHRNAASVLVLPHEDSFEFITSPAKVRTIVSKYVAGDASSSSSSSSGKDPQDGSASGHVAG